MNLVKKLALTLAIASTITLSSCGTSEELENLTANLSADSSTALTNIVFVIQCNHLFSAISTLAGSFLISLLT